MYQHHEDSLRIAIDYFQTKSRVKDGLIAIIFGGSVAKGCERPDSDLDFMVIVTDDMYAQLKSTALRQRRSTASVRIPKGTSTSNTIPSPFSLPWPTMAASPPATPG